MKKTFWGVLAVVAACTPAMATDVEFTGTVSDTCALVVSNPGTLALKADGTVLGSGEGGGDPAVVGITSIGVNQIVVKAPTLEEAPATYTTTGQSLEVAYSGPHTQAYTIAETTFEIGITTEDLTIHNRVVNTAGFDQGDYRMQTVVTCQ